MAVASAAAEAPRAPVVLSFGAGASAATVALATLPPTTEELAEDLSEDVVDVGAAEALAGLEAAHARVAEAIETPLGLAVVVGIGINLTSRTFPDEIADTATSIEAVTGKRHTADEIAEPLTRYISYFYDILMSADGPGETISHWRRRSSYYSGKLVRVRLANGAVEGETAGLEENGALRVKTPDGSVKIIQAGDVELLRPTA